MTLLEPESTGTVRTTGGPVIATERLVLRAPGVDDAKAIKSLINDRRIAENTARMPHPYTLKDARTFIDAVANGSEPAFLVTLADGRIVGGCGIASLRDDGPEIGYWIGVPYWGNGYATKAARAIVDYAFGELGYAELMAGARVSNPASRRVLEKCGFQWTGVVLQRIRSINSSAPSDRFRLDRGLWASLRSWGKLQAIA
ncbi:MAG: GNAT family N-acetyltransferase [Rhizobiales bacterium]|nr:GNAT family N-acetyltransferase [Hyphomicrobiales bacterium]